MASRNDQDLNCTRQMLALTDDAVQQLRGFNNINKFINEADLFIKLFENQVANSPDSIALIFGDKKLTYDELNKKSNQVSKLLKQSGVKPDNIVAIMMRRSLEMIVGIIAILKAGSAYLPIDPEYPAERIRFMLDDSKADIVLTQLSLANQLNLNYKAISLDDESIYVRDNENPDIVNNHNDLAYIIYTSGSTGNPKGVLIEHKALMNFIIGVPDIIDFSPNKTILALTTISFDIFVLETLIPLSRGLKVVIANEGQQKNPKQLSELIETYKISMIQMTPSRMQLLLNHDKGLNCLEKLEIIMIGGEAFPKPLLDKIKRYTNAKIYNMYGPTETTVWSSISDLTEKESIDIGKPIINTQIYIVDENNNLVDQGVEGELCIGGSGLARGYLNRQDLTAEKFIQNPFISGERIYKTGDLARLLPNGNIECIARIDNQVKIRGYRVELGEIETDLLKYKSIKQAVVSAWQGSENEKYLCAYYMSDNEILAADLREYLSINLPEHMIPAYFIRLDDIPQTPNGKIDRKALPEPILALEPKKELQIYDKSCDADLGFKIKAIIRDNIDIPISTDSIDLNSNLADLGVNSITFIKIVVTMETEFDFEFGDEDLDANKFPTVESLVTYVENRSSK